MHKNVHYFLLLNSMFFVVQDDTHYFCYSIIFVARIKIFFPCYNFAIFLPIKKKKKLLYCQGKHCCPCKFALVVVNSWLLIAFQEIFTNVGAILLQYQLHLFEQIQHQESHWCLELHSLIVGKEANEISTLQLPSYARLSPNPTLKQP